MSTVLICTKKRLNSSELNAHFSPLHASVNVCSDPMLAPKNFQQNDLSFVFLDYSFASDSLMFLKKHCAKQPICWVLCVETVLPTSLQKKFQDAGVSFIIDVPAEPHDYAASYSDMQLQHRTKLQDELAKIRVEYAYRPSSERSAIAAYNWEEDLAEAAYICPVAPKEFSSKRSEWTKIESSQLAASAKEVEPFTENIISALRHVAKEVPGATVSLLSVRPEDPLSLSKRHARVLLSSRGERFNTRVPLKALPDTRFAVQEKQNLFIENLEHISLNSAFQFAQGMKSSLTVPIVQKNVLSGILRAEFTQPVSAELFEYVQDLCLFSQSFQKSFKLMEFFSRIYSKDSTLYR